MILLQKEHVTVHNCYLSRCNSQVASIVPSIVAIAIVSTLDRRARDAPRASSLRNSRRGTIAEFRY